MRSMEITESVDCLSLLDQGAFHNAITGERNRSERSGRSFILLLIRGNEEMSAAWKSDLQLAAEVLVMLRTELDRVGWFEARRTVGLLVPEVDPVDAPIVCEQLKARWEAAVRRLDGDTCQPNVSIDLRLYPERNTSGEKVEGFLDPCLYPELSLNDNPSGTTRILKRSLDVIVSLALLTLLFPLFAVLAGLVKLSSRGPVFFRQERVGHLMKPFVMYKFRTMYVDSDHQVHQDYVSWFISSSNNAKSTNGEAVFKLTDDSRITLIGRVLRRTSFDEFPQLWNVLIGDMSLVGPRPPLPYEVEQYKPWHRKRIVDAKPGMTGLWQVVGRSRTTFDEMVRLDLQYARSMSLWFDLKILCATPGAMISGKGAR